MWSVDVDCRKWELAASNDIQMICTKLVSIHIKHKNTYTDTRAQTILMNEIDCLIGQSNRSRLNRLYSAIISAYLYLRCHFGFLWFFSCTLNESTQFIRLGHPYFIRRHRHFFVDLPCAEFSHFYSQYFWHFLYIKNIHFSIIGTVLSAMSV